jgi:hypothetical protein
MQVRTGLRILDQLSYFALDASVSSPAAVAGVDCALIPSVRELSEFVCRWVRSSMLTLEPWSAPDSLLCMPYFALEELLGSSTVVAGDESALAPLVGVLSEAISCKSYLSLLEL